MAENTNPVTMTGPEDGPSLSIVGDTYRIIRNGQQTGNDFAVIDMLVPPGGGPGPHQHPDFEETFYMLDGEIEFKSEDGTFLAHKGDFIHIPKNGMVHCFKNKSGEPAHMICTVVPAGLDSFFLEIGVPVEPGQFLEQKPPTEEQLKKLKAAAERYGQHLFPPDYLDKK